MPGQDYEATALLALEDLARGAEVNLDLSASEVTPEGGIRRVPKTVRVRVPKGAIDGQRLRVPGKGGPGMNGGPPGDLYLNIALKPHPMFRAAGHDLELDLPVTPPEAVLGAQVEVPTLDGRLNVAVRPVRGAAKSFALPAKASLCRKAGMATFIASSRSSRQRRPPQRERELYEELKRASTFNPRAHLH